MNQLVLAFGWYLVFLFSTTFHEAAHAWVAQLGGDLTAYEGGQVSLDPRPHIRREPWGMVVLPLISVLMFGWPFGFASTPYLKGARDLCRSLDLMKKQCVVGSTQLQNRCLLRQRIFHLPAAYPRIDLASLIQMDPPRFWITGRLSSVYHR